MIRSLVRLCGVLGAAVAAGPLVPAPSVAATADEVRIVSAPSSFQVGGPGGLLDVSVTRRDPECVRLAGMVVVTLPGMQYGHLRIEQFVSGQWQENPIAHSDGGTFFGEDMGVEPEFLCPGQSRTVRHRITFLAGAPAGQATIVAIVREHGGPEMGRVQVVRPVGAAARPPTSSTTPRTTHAPSGRATTASGRPTTAVASTAAAETAAGATQAIAGPEADPVEPTGVTTGLLLTGGVVGAGSLAGGLGVLLLLRRRRLHGPGRAGRDGTEWPTGPRPPGDLGPTRELPTLRR